MKLVIGGYSQGKLDYVLEKYGLQNCVVSDACPLADEIEEKKLLVINHFHLWVKECLLNGKCPEELTEELLIQYPDCIIISDEIGNGIVPMDGFEREYREKTGRILTCLAKKAEEVERVICGMGQKIK